MNLTPGCRLTCLYIKGARLLDRPDPLHTQSRGTRYVYGRRGPPWRTRLPSASTFTSGHSIGSFRAERDVSCLLECAQLSSSGCTDRKNAMEFARQRDHRTDCAHGAI